MMSTNGLVREVLSRHLDRAPSRIRPEMTLETLDITPLELILVALEVEEREDVELAVENLAEVRTVGELMTFVSKSVAANPNRDPSARHDRDGHGKSSVGGRHRTFEYGSSAHSLAFPRPSQF